MSSDCLFCKIIAGTIPSSKVYENEAVYAFLDLNPVNKGHTLVIPKTHSADLSEMAIEDATAVLDAVKRIAPKVKEATGATAYNLLSNVGADSGQMIFHTHFHIVPRHKGDGFAHWKSGSYADGEMQATAAKIAALL